MTCGDGEIRYDVGLVIERDVFEVACVRELGSLFTTPKCVREQAPPRTVDTAVVD
jgi:hypothetical protein